MPRPLSTMPFVAALTLVLGAEGVAAAAPTTADCLAASDASLKSASAHRLRDERGQLLTCAAASCPAVIRKECLAHVDEVNAQIPTLIVAAKDATGADLTAVKVSMDGEPLTSTLNGTAIPVDPGPHTFVFETSGQPTLTKTLVIQQAQKDRREIVTFGTPPSAAGPSVVEAAPAPDAASPPSEAAHASKALGPRKIAALASGGVGVVGLGLGAVFGVLAVADKSSAQSACPGSVCATQAGSDKWSTAGTAGNVSTVGFIVAGVGLGAGAVLWFTAPRTPASGSATIGVGPGSLRLQGAF